MTESALALPVQSCPLNSLTTCTTEALSGIIRKTGQDSFLETTQKCLAYKIMTQSGDALDTLKKLSTGDLVTAAGQFDHQACTVDFTNIDYVGLKKFLGKWTCKEGLFVVNDFTSMTFFPSNELMKELGTIKAPLNGKSKVNPGYVLVRPILYQYTVTSYVGKEWIMFLSDRYSTTFTTLLFDDNTITMKFYDSEAGTVKKVIVLNRNGLE